jgi:hypothetical protein
MQLFDVSPRIDNTDAFGWQSVSGRALCIAISTDGSRSYLGGHSGVWRSDDAGLNWQHIEWPQPPVGVTAVPGCIPVATIFDLAVSPLNQDTVLAAAGRDARVPAQSGIYRSTDGGANWARVHTFQRNGKVGMASRLAIAPDNPLLIYAAGQFSVAISSDGGATWTESVPDPQQEVWHVATARAEGSLRRVYAVGTAGVWYSVDGGGSWRASGASSPRLGVPADGAGVSSRALSTHPANPAIIYILDSARRLWKGDYTAFETAGAPVWSELPAIPRGPGRTPSGGTYVVAHEGPSGLFYLIASDQERVYLSWGEPASSDAWVWIDESHHSDPHGLVLTPDFELFPDIGGARGLLFAVNDGGVYTSSDGGNTWRHGQALSTLNVVNVSIGARAGKPPAICFGTGDNDGFYTSDGGGCWKTQEYLGGDNDCNFTDPKQPHRLIVFAPREKPGNIHLYTTTEGNVPDGAIHTGDLHVVPGPPAPDGTRWGWNAMSWWFNFGYRPLVLTLRGESPPPDGDLVTIRFLADRSVLFRTFALSQITKAGDWDLTSGERGIAFQAAPVLPDRAVSVVQTSGGHAKPVYYVNDPLLSIPLVDTHFLLGQQRLWKWTEGMSDWQLLVPGNQASPTAEPRIVQRFFVDPYRPNRIYLLDEKHVRRSDDGGSSWAVDTSLERCLTENGAFPFVSVDDGSAQPALLRDMNFDPDNPNYRFAVGPAGVFYTRDGRNWDHLLLSSASAMQPTNSTYDKVSDFCNRSLYVATSNRGLLRLSPLPPDWDFRMGSLVETSGRILFLRIHDVGTGYGPPGDSIDTEVIFHLDTEPEKAFGFQLRNDEHEMVNRGMLNLLRHAYANNIPVLIDFVRVSCRNGEVIRVALV